MKRILFVEDESDFRASFGAQLQRADREVEFTDIEGFSAETGEPIEVQFANWIKQAEEQNGEPFWGALLDTDLSTNQEGISQPLARDALHTLGIPTCRYSKKGKSQNSELLRQLKLRMTEGAQAVPFSLVLSLSEEPEASAAWMIELFQSFADLRELLQRNRVDGDNPASLLAKALGDRDAEVDFATYREAYPFYFADLLESAPSDQLSYRRLCTQVTYWFVNCILAFPGPLLNQGSAAAVLGLQNAEQLANDSVAAVLKDSVYTGPFSGHGPYYWRSKILDTLDEKSSAEKLAAAYQQLGLARGIGPLRYCLILDRPLVDGESPTKPDWIPAGAIESFVDKKTYNLWNPWIQTSGKK